MTFKIKMKWNSFYYETWFQSGYDILWTDLFLIICRFAMLQFGGSEADNSVAMYGAGPIL